MKKWVFLFIIIVLVGLKVIQSQAGDSNNTQSETGTEETSNSEESGSSKGSITWSKNQVHQGNLLLINPDYPVQDDAVQSDVVKLFKNRELVQGYGLLDASIQLSEDIARKWLKVVKAAQQDGVDHFLISSGYRDFDKQDELYREKGKDIAMPAGASEHNLGLSMDIGSSLMEMSKAPEGQWLKEHAWEYGFILRYPEDKVQVTGIQYEPWHFRYVGLPHSVIMHERNLSLEEYLADVKQQGHQTLEWDGKTYDITYYPNKGRQSIKLPKNKHYTLSGDNMDGVIVTIFD